MTFTVPASVSPGSPASLTVVTGGGSMSDSPGIEIAPTSNPSDYYDSTGTPPDNNQSCANYDGVGFSYSANALAAAGLTPGATVTADGLSFNWTGGQPCAPDNIGRGADDAGRRSSGVRHARPARVLDQRRHAGHGHDQLHRRDIVDGHDHLERLGRRAERQGQRLRRCPIATAHRVARSSQPCMCTEPRCRSTRTRRCSRSPSRT